MAEPTPFLLKGHSEGLALCEAVDVEAQVPEDVAGKWEAALTSTTTAPDGTRPEGGAGVAACDEDAVALVLEDVAVELEEALTSTATAPDGIRPVGGAGVAAPCPTTAPDGIRPMG